MKFSKLKLRQRPSQLGVTRKYLPAILPTLVSVLDISNCRKTRAITAASRDESCAAYTFRDWKGALQNWLI